jgi:hypothetical protein
LGLSRKLGSLHCISPIAKPARGLDDDAWVQDVFSQWLPEHGKHAGEALDDGDNSLRRAEDDVQAALNDRVLPAPVLLYPPLALGVADASREGWLGRHPACSLAGECETREDVLHDHVVAQQSMLRLLEEFGNAVCLSTHEEGDGQAELIGDRAQMLQLDLEADFGRDAKELRARNRGGSCWSGHGALIHD